MSMRSPLGRARGHGSGNSGTEHWYIERLTALALVPLTIWFAVSLITGLGADYASLKAWMALPGNMTLMILLILVFFWHASLALGTVIDDYVHHKAAHMAGVIAVKFGSILLGVFTTVCVLKIGLGG